MAAPAFSEEIPIPEQTLRDLSKGIVGIFPDFAEQEPDLGAK